MLTTVPDDAVLFEKIVEDNSNAEFLKRVHIALDQRDAACAIASDHRAEEDFKDPIRRPSSQQSLRVRDKATR